MTKRKYAQNHQTNKYSFGCLSVPRWAGVYWWTRARGNPMSFFVMANPQKENGYTPIANETMEAFCRIRINGQARQCLDVILRKTYGFQKKEDSISLSQFCGMTLLKKPTVCKALNKLKTMNIITQKDNQIANSYVFNKDFDTWKPLPKKITITQKDNDHYPKRKSSLPKKIHTIETLTKETLTKESEFFKNERFCIAWEGYREMRKKIGRPLVLYAEKLALRKLEKLEKDDIEQVIAIVEQSIFFSWQGLFPLKQENEPLTDEEKMFAHARMLVAKYGNDSAFSKFTDSHITPHYTPADRLKRFKSLEW